MKSAGSASLSTGFIPVGATTGSYQLTPPPLPLSTGFIPEQKRVASS